MYESKLKSEETDKLFAAILSLENEEECYRFFEDLLTITELKSITQRFNVMLRLADGATFNDVIKATGASSATVTRVKRCLTYGANGYTTVYNRLKEGKDK